MTVLICPNCSIRYETAAAIAPEGRKVRCSQCGQVWNATLESERPEAAPRPEAVPGPSAEPASEQPEKLPAVAAPEDDVIFREEPEAPPPPIETEEEPPPEEKPVRPAPRQPANVGPSARAADLRAAADSAVERHAIRSDFMREPLPAPPRPAPPPTTTARAAQPSGAMLAVGWGALAVVVGGLALFLGLAPEVVVRTLPGTARLYAELGVAVNVRGLAFENVAYDWADEDGRPSLDVKGEIVNLTGAALPTPPVLFELRDGEAVEVFQWVTKVREAPIPAGERAQFSARIPSPPGAIRSVQLRFAGPG